MSWSRIESIPIRLRLAIGYVVLVIVTVAVVGTFALWTLANQIQGDTDNALHLRASLVQGEFARVASQGITSGEAETVLDNISPQNVFSTPGIYVQVRDPHGVILASSANLPQGQFPEVEPLIEAALKGQETYASIRVGNERVRVHGVPVYGDNQVVGVVLVGQALHLLDQTFLEMEKLLVLAAAGIALIALAGGWWLTGRALGPVVAATRDAQRITSNRRFDQRISVPSAGDELRELTTTFNDLLQRLEAIVIHQREFLADASHELRGPLTVIRGNLDLLRLGLSDEERAHCIREATVEVERMAGLVSDLLFLAETDAQDVVEREPVALDQILTSVWQRALAMDGGRHLIVLEQAEPTTVLGDSARLEQLIWNLVENALRYTPTDGAITLSLKDRGNLMDLVVADTGIGINASHLGRIFERFYRVDPARSRSQGGSGLGLAIVKQVTEAHGGTVRVTSEPDHGSTFTVSLPRVTTSSTEALAPQVHS